MEYIKNMGIDEIRSFLQWVSDRRRYRIACDLPADCEDLKAESAALARLREITDPDGLYILDRAPSVQFAVIPF